MREVKDWSDITIGQYQEMMMVQSETSIGKFIECLAIVLDEDPSVLRELPYADYKELQSKFSFINKDPQNEIVYRFELDGKRYGLMRDMNLMTAGLFIDAEEFKKDPMVNLHNTVALIYRPIIEESEDDWKIEEHKSQGFERRANLFRDKLSIQTVMGAVLFFSLLAMELSTNSLESFKSQMEAQASQMKTKTTQTPTKKRKQKPSKNNGVSTT